MPDTPLRAAASLLDGETRDRIEGRFRARTRASRAAHRRALPFLPGGINRQIAHFDPYPLFVERGEGAWISDLDDNEYLDALGNFASLVLGHCNVRVMNAVWDQLSRGTAWAGGSALEAELASTLVRRIPSVEKVRFTSSGTEATLMAVRVARAVTGRPLVVKFAGGYHGLHDYAMVGLAPPPDGLRYDECGFASAPPGIPDPIRDTVVVLPFNDLAAAEHVLVEKAEQIAAVLVEPVMGVAGVIVPRNGFLEGLRRLTKRLGILLVFDEVITFRLAMGGAQELFGVDPDLTTLGKVIGGGFPIGALGGRDELMHVFDPSTGPAVLLSGTFHANPVVLTAGLVTLEQFSGQCVDELNSRGEAVCRRLETLFASASSPIRLTGIGSLFNIHFTDDEVVDQSTAAKADNDLLRWLHLALLNEGVLVAQRGMGCLSVPMSANDEDCLVDGFARALEALGLL